MLYLASKVAMQIIAVALAILASYLNYLWSDKRTRKFKRGRRILFILSFIFLFGSIGVTLVDEYSKRQEAAEAAKREAALNSQIRKVQEQNDGLQKGIAVLSEKSSGILQEQRDSFFSVLNDQRKIGDDTAEKIEGSANLLRRRVDNSIDLLNLSTRELNRAVNPIKGAIISFSANVKMDSPSLSAYRKRFESGIADYLIKNTTIDDYEEQKDGVQVVAGGDEYEMFIRQGSSLLPNPKTEKHAFMVLNYFVIKIDIYKTPLTAEELEFWRDSYSYMYYRRPYLYRRPDLEIPVILAISPEGNGQVPGISLFYTTKKKYSLTADNIPCSTNTWRSTGAITSVPDLIGAQMIISLEIKEQEIESFEIKVSDGISFDFNGNTMEQHTKPRSGNKYYIGYFKK